MRPAASTWCSAAAVAILILAVVAIHIATGGTSLARTDAASQPGGQLPVFGRRWLRDTDGPSQARPPGASQPPAVAVPAGTHQSAG